MTKQQPVPLPDRQPCRDCGRITRGTLCLRCLWRRWGYEA